VLQYGTARAAALGQFAAGKTGTTSNYGDAWFVGWDSRYTVAVWVGYPNGLVPMTTAFDGGPVLGGTFPALIWHDFMTSAMQVEKARAEHSSRKSTASEGAGASGPSTSETGPPSSSTAAADAPPSSSGTSKAKGNSAAPSTPGGSGAGSPSAGAEHTPAAAAPPAAAPPASSSPAPSTPPPASSASPTGGVSAGG